MNRFVFALTLFVFSLGFSTAFAQEQTPKSSSLKQEVKKMKRDFKASKDTITNNVADGYKNFRRDFKKVFNKKNYKTQYNRVREDVKAKWDNSALKELFSKDD